MLSNLFDSVALSQTYFGNTVAQYIDALAYFLIALFILAIVQRIVLARLATFAKKTSTEIDNVAVEFIQSIRPRLYVILALYFALHTLDLHSLVKSGLNILVIVIIIIQVTRSLQIIIEFSAKKISSNEDDEHTRSAAHLLGALMTIVVWVFGIMMILSNIGVNITSLVAGVGIGGIAIAFAVKEVLADLFSSFAIYFDKPFRAGDVVKVGTEAGVVKKIGVKTTRIETRTGEEMIISNQDLTSSRVHNYHRMSCRNVRANFIVEMKTPSDKLRALPKEIENRISQIPHVIFSRAHFKKFDGWGLQYEVGYKIDSRDYSLYMESQEQANLAIKDAVETLEIELAEIEKSL